MSCHPWIATGYSGSLNKNRKDLNFKVSVKPKFVKLQIFVILMTIFNLSQIFKTNTVARAETQELALEKALSITNEINPTPLPQLPLTTISITTPVELLPPPKRDPRAEKLEIYLMKQNSYLADYTDLIVSESDKYGVNPEVLVVISGVESGYCKINFKPYNCWGYGDFSWSSPEEAITEYMRLMNIGYFSKGAKTLESIASPYNPWPEEYLVKLNILRYQMLNMIGSL